MKTLTPTPVSSQRRFAVPGMRSPCGHPTRGRPAVVICHKGLKLSQGVAAHLRHEGVPADTLEGGTWEWCQASLPAVPARNLPLRDSQGRTVWVTRARPKVDRIACPWLIRRFVDPKAVFLFVSPSEVLAVAEKFGAAPFDIEGERVFWSHRGDRCTFDVMVEELGLAMNRSCDWHPSSGGLTRLGWSLRHKQRACWPFHSGCRGCTPPTWSSSKPEWSCMTLSTGGVGMRPMKSTTGLLESNRGPADDRHRDSLSSSGRPFVPEPRGIPSRSRQGLDSYCAVELRRAGRTDRGHASNPCRGEAVAG